MRPVLRPHFPHVNACIFVVDSRDTRRDWAKREFDLMMSEPQLQGVPLLIFANKQVFYILYCSHHAL